MFLKGIWKFRGLVFGALLLSFLSGCKTLTRSMVYDVGMDNAPRFQFYISKTLKLEREANESNATVTEKGIGQVTKKFIRDEIIISKYTPGISKSDGWEVVGEILSVSFEEGESVYFRWNESEKKYLIDSRQRQLEKKPVYEIEYGGQVYLFSNKGVLPYLKVRMVRQAVNESNKRRVKGLRVQQG